MVKTFFLNSVYGVGQECIVATRDIKNISLPSIHDLLTIETRPGFQHHAPLGSWELSSV